jgi:hypothetical protein
MESGTEAEDLPERVSYQQDEWFKTHYLESERVF